MKNTYITVGEVTKIAINTSYGIIYTLIDTDDLDKIRDFSNTSWCVNYSKNDGIDGVKTKIQKNGIRKQYWLHRLITDCPDCYSVDHINGNTLDNRKQNLRISTQAENATNISMLKNSTTGYRNVTFEKGRYRVRFTKNGKSISLGRYETIEEAIKVANDHRKHIFPLSR